MRIARNFWKLLLPLGAVLLAMYPAAAEDLSIDDLIGKWCGDVTNYTFSRTQLTVTPLHGYRLAHNTVWKIARVEGSSDQIDVYWGSAPGDFTRFEFSDDKRQLIQVQETEGDKGPRRVFHRC